MGVGRSVLGSSANPRLGVNVKPDPCRADPTASLRPRVFLSRGAPRLWFVCLGYPWDPLWSWNSSRSQPVYLGIGKMRVGEGRAEVGADLTLLLPPFSVKMDWGEFRWL